MLYDPNQFKNQNPEMLASYFRHCKLAYIGIGDVYKGLRIVNPFGHVLILTITKTNSQICHHCLSAN